jgi:tetratricopeptide (TPR) repeat protein
MDRLKKQSDMFKELLATCNKRLMSEPDNMEVFELRGLLYNVAEMYDKAIDDLNRVIKNLPDDENAYYLRSDCYYMKKDFNSAKQDYLRALKVQMKDEQEFVSKHTEEVIKEAKIENEQELNDMKKVLEYEKARILLYYLPELAE